ncbi:MAG TPA: alpha-glucan family phosphorylase [Polyangiaceae bacterium LLY-WYZ-15_(1-7)]|nr:alpha-glucan phosphorylase [Myxococcales bacterium]MAT25205.1 alpha-glucan phosphorylase [Sandaracinus sp.]HJL03574.1 alpha-glucan family phosphorylase [Polyangiaceae bacterium LLY-WYZ-15_(1-7)]MBJ75127.1 alpha-glucan phosphorylase [Sandaracinus sp.]HJL09384.1 alpha-glucan family phosphorylase [Polyangiaceae bacterium LLY-WYZ-15_(1-7)]
MDAKRRDPKVRSDEATRLRAQLEELAGNLFWSWFSKGTGVDGATIFRALDPARWEATNHDPHALLDGMDDDALADAVARTGLERAIDEAVRALHAYLDAEDSWAEGRAGTLHREPIAYFSAEFGVHESLAIYSGGLGVLAGDHLKSASDLGLPLVGVGLFYREGYFRQALDGEGRQTETYPAVDPADEGLSPVRDLAGAPVRVAVEHEEGTIHAQVWEARVGRVRLLLLDTDVEENDAETRRLTARLYGGGHAMRIRQELLLGVGGLRALEAAGIRPGVLHLNEGHSAFAALEAAARRVEREGLSIEEARHEVASRTIFTTHTPVPAGHDRFEPELVLAHLRPLAERLGLDDDALLALGRVDAEDEEETFCMTVLALRFAHRVNGVSFLHGRVSREMWAELWPARKRHEIPIGHVTNGVHLPTFMAPRMRTLLDGVLPTGWAHRAWDPEVWQAALELDDRALWEIRHGLKRDLCAFVRLRASTEARERGESAEVVAALEEALDEDALLVGFARRFATYKRAALLLKDLDALDELVNDPERPMRVVFAGKAHPKDEGGKKLIQRVFEVGRDPRFLGKVILLSDYDIGVGRGLTRGVDVWLNNPRRPLEASGTSGQKVVLNGGLNCSILDGWWAEGWDGENGFAIGDGEVHKDIRLQDARDHEALVAVLRDEVKPLFYTREHGLPLEWLHRVKRGFATLAWRFNSDRMVRDYAVGSYFPAAGVQLADHR